MIQDLYNSTNSKSLKSYYGFAPKSILKGKGVTLFDENGREFLDCGMALGSVSLGYGNNIVDNFVVEQLQNGVNFSRPSHLEEKLTHLLSKHLTKDSLRIKYSKSSSLILSVIPRIARCLTGKERIAYPINCFLGNTDWYLSKTRTSGGIPDSVKTTVLNFKAGDIASLQKLFEEHKYHLSCIVLEPYRQTPHSKEFYVLLRQLCNEHGVMLVFDETITGYRFSFPLAQNHVRCIPDLTVIGKAFANGYALAAVVGSLSMMNTIEETKDLFDFSTTHAGETIGLSAALKTLEIYENERVIDVLNSRGEFLMKSIEDLMKSHGLDNYLKLVGHPTYFTLIPNDPMHGETIKKYLIEFFFQHNILFRGTFSMSMAHEDSQLDKILEKFLAFCKIFEKYLNCKKD